MITIINGAIRNFLSSIQIPIFSGIVVVLIVIGELNFWSKQVSYQTEPFSSVGQWANVVATVIVVLGSLFYVRNERESNGEEDTGSSHSRDIKSPGLNHTIHSNRDHESRDSSIPRSLSRIPTEHVMDIPSVQHEIPENPHPDEWIRDSIELRTVTTNTNYQPVPLSISNRHRNKVATLLNQFGEYLGTPAQDRYDNSVFEEGKTEFPEIPGEAGRVHGFEEIRDWYRNTHQLEEGAGVIPAISRVESFSSIRTADRDVSPSRSPRSPSRSNTTPTEPSEYLPPELDRVTTSPVAGPSRRPRRDTLEVPSRPRPAHIRLGNSPSSSAPPPIMLPGTQGSPKIVVSAEPEDTSPTTPTMRGSSFGPP